MSDSENIKVAGVDITTDVWSVLADTFQDELNRAEREQIALMEAEKRLTGGERKNLPFGRLRMKVCKEVHSFWADKLGESCWRDKSFLDYMEKRFGDLVKIKSRSSNIVV